MRLPTVFAAFLGLFFAALVGPARAGAGEATPSLGAETVLAPKTAQTQWTPAAAFDGKGTFLVVWQEGGGNAGGEADILGARVNSGGKVLDAEPLAISRAKDFQRRPAVAWNGREWLVVWQDARDFEETGYDIYAARVTAEGKCLDPEGIAVCTAKEDQQMPAVASDGASFLVLWADYRSGKDYDVYGTVVQDGKAGTATAILAMGGEQLAPSACWTGDGYLVGSAFNGQSGSSQGALVCRVDRGGKPVGKATNTSGVATFDVAVGAGGRHGILVATAQCGKLYSPSHCYAVFLNPDGSLAKPDNSGRPPFSDSRVTGPSAIQLNGKGGSGNVHAPAAAGSGEWLLALYDDAAADGGKWNRPENPHTAVHYAVVRSADGRVGSEGVLADGMRAEAAGGRDGRFLVVYERHGVEHKVAFRMVTAK